MLGVLISACTPLGVWVYTEPKVRLGAIRLATGGDPGAPPLGLDLTLDNPNDFEVSVIGVDALVRLDDQPLGTGRSPASVTVMNRESRNVAVDVPMHDTTANRLYRVLRSGTHSYTIAGKVTIRTPIGERQVPFAIEGRGAFGEQGGAIGGH